MLRWRFVVVADWIARLLLVAMAGSWLFLYLDSIHQRRRAESLFADLKSFNFASAGFAEVRDMIVRHGGEVAPRSRSNCTPEGCTFQVWITTALPRMERSGAEWLLGNTGRFLYDALPYVGVRSWVVAGIFEVRDGKLERSFTSASEVRMEWLDSRKYKDMVPYGYEVETWRDAADLFPRCTKEGYSVFIDHGSYKVPSNALHACVLQSEAMPTKRVFDVNLHCLNGIFRGCRFDELAPSAWADYSAKRSHLNNR